jgi:hypothetical protein
VAVGQRKACEKVASGRSGLLKIASLRVLPVATKDSRCVAQWIVQPPPKGQMQVRFLPYRPDEVRMCDSPIPNCEACANRDLTWADSPGDYSLMCKAPEVLALLDITLGPANSATRCQEAREYKFACGNMGRFFVPIKG